MTAVPMDLRLQLPFCQGDALLCAWWTKTPTHEQWEHVLKFLHLFGEGLEPSPTASSPPEGSTDNPPQSAIDVAARENAP